VERLAEGQLKPPTESPPMHQFAQRQHLHQQPIPKRTLIRTPEWPLCANAARPAGLRRAWPPQPRKADRAAVTSSATSPAAARGIPLRQRKGEASSRTCAKPLRWRDTLKPRRTGRQHCAMTSWICILGVRLTFRPWRCWLRSCCGCSPTDQRKPCPCPCEIDRSLPANRC